MSERRKSTKVCSFCGRDESQVKLLITGMDGFICDDCVVQAYEILKETGVMSGSKGKGGDFELKEVPKPHEIKAYLDQYVIGQDEAKRYLAVSVYNHYKRLQQNIEDDGVEIEKSNIIMVGSTGTGKTLLARTIAKLLEGSVVNVPPQGGRKHPDQEYIHVDTKNILFICGGAFDGIERKIAQRLNTHVVGYNSVQNVSKIDKKDLMKYILPQDLKSFGLIPEIIGRLPVLTYLNPLDREALRSILVEPKNSIIKQYMKLFEMDGIKLSFDEDALDFIVDKATEYKLGARGLRSIVENVMMDAMFDVPSMKVKKFNVTLDYTKKQLDKAHLQKLETD